MTFKELMDILDAFDTARNWHGLAPADLAKSIMLEGAELLEHFQWDDSLRMHKQEAPARNVEEIAYEAADVLIYLMKFCREMEIDLCAAALRKLEKVGKKYPPRDGINDPKDSWGHDAYLAIKKEQRAQQK